MSCVVILGSANWDANSATGNQKFFKKLIVSNLNHICMIVTQLVPGRLLRGYVVFPAYLRLFGDKWGILLGIGVAATSPEPV